MARSVEYDELDELSDMVIHGPPPLDPKWLAYEQQVGLQAPTPGVRPPKQPIEEILLRQCQYARDQRAMHARLMAPGARYEQLGEGVSTAWCSIYSSKDGKEIRILKYELSSPSTEVKDKRTIIIYYHGGGLYVGEADSEDLSCRQLLKAGLKGTTIVYSVGYRLMPQVRAAVCKQDSIDAYEHIQRHTGDGDKVVIVGSSSGGQLAAFVSQHAAKAHIHGVMLRCPVTSDAFSGIEHYVPPYLQRSHTSTRAEFFTSLLGWMYRDMPRDGLPLMPLEAGDEQITGMPRTWIQVCTSDTLYSDGVCYAMMLETVDAEVRVDVVESFPHTFWLKEPLLDRAIQADRDMVESLFWILGEDHAETQVSDVDTDMLDADPVLNGYDSDLVDEAEGGDYTWRH